jgi:hypothetical protein
LGQPEGPPQQQSALLPHQAVAGSTGGPFTFADFLVFSQDRHAGPDTSINRLGSTPRKTRTLATFVVQLSDDAPHVFIRMSNPGEPDTVVNFRLEPALWVSGLPEKIQAIPLSWRSSEGPLD